MQKSRIILIDIFYGRKGEVKMKKIAIVFFLVVIIIIIYASCSGKSSYDAGNIYEDSSHTTYDNYNDDGYKSKYERDVDDIAEAYGEDPEKVDDIIGALSDEIN